MSNPLLEFADLPPFSKIQPAHVEPAIDCVLAEGRALIEQLLTRHTAYTWDNLVQPIEDMRERLDRVWSL